MSSSTGVALSAKVASALISTDSQSGLSQENLKAIQIIAKNEGIPLAGITLLGGKPYINQTGLDVKIANLCKKQKLVKRSVKVELIDEYDGQDGEYRAGFKGTVELFDKVGYQKALETLAPSSNLANGESVSQALKELADLFTYRYVGEGWAGHKSVKMSTMKNKDFLRMMAGRRASNRAKREATGTGLTSVEEMDLEFDEQSVPQGRVIREETAPLPAEEDVDNTGADTTAADPPWAKSERKIVRATFNGDKVELTGETFKIKDDLKAKFGARWKTEFKGWTVAPSWLQDVKDLCEENGLELVED